MYDTLLQMGRWFGYRPGYLDLCRLYLTPELRSWFGTITRATDELMELFDEMAAAGGTPTDFGLRIRSNADGLTVTSPAKMQRGKKVKVSYSGDISETVNFYTDPNILNSNLSVAEDLIRRLGAWSHQGTAPGDPKSKVWLGVDSGHVSAFLGRFRTHEAAQKANAKAMGDYVAGRVRDGELGRWAVLLASNSSAEEIAEIAGIRVGLIRRAAEGEDDGRVTGTRYDIGRLVNPPDEKTGLGPEHVRRALEMTVERWNEKRLLSGIIDDEKPPTEPSGRILRRLRAPEEGLLMIYPLRPPDGISGTASVIGFAVSFPESRSNDSAVDYVVNQVWLQQEFQWDG
jgi:hypothetical protein